MRQRLLGYCTPSTAAWALIAAGVAARVYVYAANRSLWLDEILLATGIVGRSWDRLLDLLPNDQAAPLGFVLGEVIAVRWLGVSELALRALPLLTGILTLFVFHVLARSVLETRAALFALATVALSNSLIYFSAEVKPYAVDALMTCLILLATAGFLRKPGSAPHIALLSVTGAVAVWLSYPAVFVLCGAAVGMAAAWLPKAGWRRISIDAVAVWMVWGLSFGAHYMLWIADQSNNELWAQVWSNDFMPTHLLCLTTLRWSYFRIMHLLVDPVGFAYAGTAVALLFIGAISLLKRRGGVDLAIVISILIAFAVSATGDMRGRQSSML